ncbi:hypothetical protein GCM10010218_20060 [Streptomyces mashuensis]|uniref:Uncharacterized protein n=1 Tax=Streptomyces mashuensis TaxID=33904 RepID=A0A919B120_9ACTN|nr:hypothetical protein [Streptomyces mashuensis]GHF38808.1 hypothetical protein GCM10010218_20060 [Streptomyces mashuensis]
MSTYTQEQISRTINDGADLVADGLGLDERDADLLNLMVNAALSLLEDPTLSLNDVMDRNYDGGAEEVLSWWDWK